MKRIFRLVLKNGDEIDLNLVKATSIKADVGLLHLDKISDKGYRLIISQDIVEDISKVTRIEIVREDGTIRPSYYIRVNDGVTTHYMRLYDSNTYKYCEDSTGWVIKIRLDGNKMYVVCPNAPAVHNVQAHEISYEFWKQHQF